MAEIEIDEYDLLDAKIDEFDSMAMSQRYLLEVEIADETAFLRAKAAFRASMDASNPMKIDL